MGLTVIGALIIAFITGLLARFALPGPDPMPAWLTIAIGITGTVIGAGIAYAIAGNDPVWLQTGAFLCSVVIVGGYRRFVQKRPLFGQDAYKYPQRGIGVEQYRERLKKVGIDPDQIGVAQPFGAPQPGVAVPRPAASAHDDPGEPTENPAHYLGLLEELHDSGVLDDSEYDAARLRLLEKLR